MPTINDFSNYQFPDNRNTAGGDFTQTADASTTLDVPTGNYPNIRGYGYDSDNREFSSDVNGNPEALLEQTRAGVEAHANLNKAYGLCQPVATLGVTPWLRDSLAVPGEEEPGNAEPSPVSGCRLQMEGGPFETCTRSRTVVAMAEGPEAA